MHLQEEQFGSEKFGTEGMTDELAISALPRCIESIGHELYGCQL